MASGFAYYIAFVKKEERKSRQLKVPEVPKITLEKIKNESPRCNKIAKDLGIKLEELLIAEHYNNITPLLKNEENLIKVREKIKNYEYKQNRLDFLKHSANRIEENPEKYNKLTFSDFEYLKKECINDFNAFKNILNEWE